VKKIKILAAIALLAVCALSLMPNPSADALPSQEVYRLYYADSAKTQLVGEKWVTSCYGVVNIMLWGVQTSYYRSVSEPCSF
jgi:hypothetical protein